MNLQIERWEFGSIEWVEYASGLGVSLLEQAELDLSRYEWGFSEEYTNIPERLLAGRDKAGYHLMIQNGKVSGGASLPDECLALPGFHASIDWALIAHSSYFPLTWRACISARPNKRTCERTWRRQGCPSCGTYRDSEKSPK